MTFEEQVIKKFASFLKEANLRRKNLEKTLSNFNNRRKNMNHNVKITVTGIDLSPEDTIDLIQDMKKIVDEHLIDLRIETEACQEPEQL